MKKKLTGEELGCLGRRAVAAKGWDFRPGMKLLSCCGRLWRGWLLQINAGRRIQDENGSTYIFYPSECIPDLNDPGTLGHLHDLVELAWSLPDGIELHHSSDEGVWRATWSSATHGGECGVGVTKAEALIDALERA